MLSSASSSACSPQDRNSEGLLLDARTHLNNLADVFQTRTSCFAEEHMFALKEASCCVAVSFDLARPRTLRESLPNFRALRVTPIAFPSHEIANVLQRNNDPVGSGAARRGPGELAPGSSWSGVHWGHRRSCCSHPFCKEFRRGGRFSKSFSGASKLRIRPECTSRHD